MENCEIKYEGRYIRITSDFYMEIAKTIKV